MNKSELIDKVSKQEGMNRAVVGPVVDAMIDQIAASLKAGEPVKVMGFGGFEVRSRKARIIRDPRNGDPLAIPPSKTVKFTASKDLKASVNS